MPRELYRPSAAHHHLRPRHLFEEAVHVSHEGAVAAPGEDGRVPALEDDASDGARVVQGAGVEDILRRDEVLQLAPEPVRDGRRIGVEQHRHALVVPDWKSLDGHTLSLPRKPRGRSVANMRPESDTPRDVTNPKHSGHMNVFRVGVKHTPRAVSLRTGGDGA